MTMCIYCGDRVGIVCDACASTAKERDELRAEVERLNDVINSMGYEIDELRVYAADCRHDVEVELQMGKLLREQIQQLQSHKICLEEGEECIAVKLRDELEMQDELLRHSYPQLSCFCDSGAYCVKCELYGYLEGKEYA